MVPVSAFATERPLPTRSELRMRVLLIEDNVKPAASLEVSLVQQGCSVDLAGTA